MRKKKSIILFLIVSILGVGFLNGEDGDDGGRWHPSWIHNAPLEDCDGTAGDCVTNLIPTLP